MLLRLYSAYMPSPTTSPAVKSEDEERPRVVNGNGRIPNAADRRAQDAQEFELEGLMSDEDEDAAKPLNGHAR